MDTFSPPFVTNHKQNTSEQNLINQKHHDLASPRAKGTFNLPVNQFSYNMLG